MVFAKAIILQVCDKSVRMLNFPSLGGTNRPSRTGNDKIIGVSNALLMELFGIKLYQQTDVVSEKLAENIISSLTKQRTEAYMKSTYYTSTIRANPHERTPYKQAFEQSKYALTVSISKMDSSAHRTNATKTDIIYC